MISKSQSNQHFKTMKSKFRYCRLSPSQKQLLDLYAMEYGIFPPSYYCQQEIQFPLNKLISSMDKDEARVFKRKFRKLKRKVRKLKKYNELAVSEAGIAYLFEEKYNVE